MKATNLYVTLINPIENNEERELKVNLSNGTQITICGCQGSWQQYGGDERELWVTVPIAESAAAWLNGEEEYDEYKMERIRLDIADEYLRENLESVCNGIEDFDERLGIALRKMDMYRCPLRMADISLYNEIAEAIGEFAVENNFDEDYFDVETIVL